ncbi:MAG: 16S rRNA (adenine(1518)-N(6)/adenine(1519)-N(6))-dimethyltransferase [Lentimicrobiaceae bacterium]|jgi:16S rRNA (adenine1518-N6/adenine1519-N6)-dimethyltransferase|nr:16S rRNA (adenine(1518)-N(6)/adenine(1519)-N(6))-dimethyltransferase [Lentimicrobiaceae bacterium]|tara:strand:+ start:13674 stop:14471 length:798 start_codon:yes stop_codon:yes gene_type:complete
MVKPKKHLGQHFLKDQNIAQKIVECLNANFENVVEVGPGTGILTEPLLNRIPKLKLLSLVEIDSESVEYLKDNFNDPRLHIYEDNFLKMNIRNVTTEEFSLIGNFPYNISSQILFKVIENRTQISQVVGMIQKEVAERIASPHGSKAYGILSVLLQNWFNIEYCFTVNENVFYPPPKVKSAVVRLTRNDLTKLDCNEVLLFKVVKMVFNQRRKTIRNTLKSILPNISQSDHPYFSKRPEQLSPTDFIELTNVVSQMTSDQSSNTK